MFWNYLNKLFVILIFLFIFLVSDSNAGIKKFGVLAEAGFKLPSLSDEDAGPSLGVAAGLNIPISKGWELTGKFSYWKSNYKVEDNIDVLSFNILFSHLFRFNLIEHKPYFGFGTSGFTHNSPEGTERNTVLSLSVGYAFSYYLEEDTKTYLFLERNFCSDITIGSGRNPFYVNTWTLGAGFNLFFEI